MIEARNFTYMFYGFLAAWLILVFFVATMVARERNIKKELARLRNMLEQREQPR